MKTGEKLVSPTKLNKMMNDEVPAGIPDTLLVDWTPWVWPGHGTI